MWTRNPMQMNSQLNKARQEMKQNPLQMMAQFNRFLHELQGNPQEEVQKLLASGQMTQQELNQLQSMASDFQALLMNTKI